ncbi:hypothetical protein ACFQL1_20385 [Halomicroarcula sp. GCM10025709]|uniref:hypothetical protein n=1 Tax=Haloarcula TaxID=2237 RepID=UPI0024C3F1A4|nr:hypothetical protein [Halomicroarcula sp. YJ-61-S]
MTRIFRVLTALLVVASTLTAAVGPAAAVPSNAGKNTWTGVSPSGDHEDIEINLAGPTANGEITEARIVVENDTTELGNWTVDDNSNTWTVDLEGHSPST